MAVLHYAGFVNTEPGGGMPSGSTVRERLAGRLPVYYGWVIFAMASLPSFGARPVASVAVLSVFVIPMTEEFGWSRGLFSGAVSLGAVCGLLMSPFAGRMIDRYGSGVILAGCSAVVGTCALLLAVVSQAWSFYAIYIPGRAVFSSPLELGTTTAISNWFIRRRPMALASFGAVQGVGLGLLPLAAAIFIDVLGWRSAWVTLGVFTVATGVLPPLLLMARRPEDLGLAPDPAPEGKQEQAPSTSPTTAQAAQSSTWRDTDYTVHEALRTPAFWILAFFSMVGFMAQAGVSLHQTAHYVDAGVSHGRAALVATAFALGQIPGGMVWSGVGRRLPVRMMLAISAGWVTGGVFGIAFSQQLGWGIVFGFLFGSGVGGLHTMLRLAWADYYGRQHLGTIRGLTLPAQIGGQAIGPVVSGFMFDVGGGYRAPFVIFGSAIGLAALMVLAAVPPGRKGSSPEASPTP